MENINPDLLFGYVGSIASLIGLVVALIQSIKLKKFKKETKSKIWSGISSTKALMEDLENYKCEAAHARASEHFRDLLREAVLSEKNFSYKTIKSWRLRGRLSSRWQQKNALILLENEGINDKECEELNEVFRDWDAFPPDHSFAHEKPTIDKDQYRKSQGNSRDTIPNPTK